MNPFGLRSAHVLAARSRLARRSKTPPMTCSKRRSCAQRSNSTHDCEDIFGYAKFTSIRPEQ
jgi:hypothetical protein